MLNLAGNKTLDKVEKIGKKEIRSYLKNAGNSVFEINGRLS
jgi:hypothetical protein